MRSAFFRGGVLLLPVLAAAAAQAAQWVVDDDGPADFRTVKAAVAAPYVLSGDTLLVRPGTYRGAITLSSKDLDIRSEAGPALTTLDAVGEGSVLSLENRGPGTRIEGFTITGGTSETGGGIWIFGGAPTITRNIVEGNSAVGGFLGYGYGGGIEIYSAAPVITRNVIRDNTARDGGGGIDVYYAGPSTPGTCCPLLAQNTIVGNVVTGAAGLGGGILSSASEPRVSSCIVDGNRAASGGGIFVERLGNHDQADVAFGIFHANVPDDAASNASWRLPSSNRHVDPRLGQGEAIALWPRSDSPALDAAESGIAPSIDLAGRCASCDGDLDGVAAPDVGALEGRGEITGLVAKPEPLVPWATRLSWDGWLDPAVRFHVYASDGDPFVVDGGACIAASLQQTWFLDEQVLGPGAGRFYLVTALAATGEGPRGWRSDGTPRPDVPSCLP